jgi:very-short-patch-repair endonuclease
MDWSNLQKDYERLGSFAAVADEYGVSRSAVSQQVTKQGWHRKDWSKLPEMYAGGMTYEELAAHFGCKSLSTIGNRLRAMGVEPEHRGMTGRTWSDEHRANFMEAVEKSAVYRTWTPKRQAAHRAATTDNPEWRAKNAAHLEATRGTRRPSVNPPSEVALQEALKRARLSFETQASLLNRYCADALLHQAPVVIEVDGWSHKLKGDADRQRDAAVIAAGFQVFRFTNEAMNASPDDCVRRVMEACRLSPEADPVAIIRDHRTGMIREGNPNWDGGRLETRTCEYCGTGFEAKPRNGGRPARFCKYECYWDWMRGRPRDQRS